MRIVRGGSHYRSTSADLILGGNSLRYSHVLPHSTISSTVSTEYRVIVMIDLFARNSSFNNGNSIFADIRPCKGEYSMSFQLYSPHNPSFLILVLVY